MGNCVGGFRRRTTTISPWKKSRNIVVLFIGVNGAGKTTILKTLQGGDIGTVMPTVGFSRTEFNLKHQKIVAYDLGGEERLRDIWQTYYSEVYGIVYVVDAAAANRIDENKHIISSLVDRPELLHKPILFLLNKQDLPDTINEFAFSEAFNLHDLAKHNRTDIRVESICAVKGSGKNADNTIRESIDWLVEKITSNYAVIDKGVTIVLNQLKKRQTQDRLERQHRLAEINNTLENMKDKLEDPSFKSSSPASMSINNSGISAYGIEKSPSHEFTNQNIIESNTI